MKRDWKRLADKQKQIVSDGFASGNALICGDGSGSFFENYEGTKSADPRDTLREDTVFHLYSMTKVFTAVSAMKLYEQGLLDLDAPVKDFLPAFSKVSVFENGKTRPAETEVTVGMLLSMTSGLSYFLSDGSGKAAEMAERWRKDLKEGRHWNTVRFANETASVPLSFEPGTSYLYGLSHDVLGAVIEIISGDGLDRFFEKNIFAPLGMKDTYFYGKIPERLKPKLASDTAFGKKGYENIPLLPRPVPIPAFEGTEDEEMLSGGSGLVGTARDYALFLQEMLAPEKGIISKKTIDFMTRPRLNKAQRARYNDPSGDPSISGPEHTFALGVRVQDKAAHQGSIGEWGWSGALGTWFFVSPNDGVWFVYMHQHSPANHDSFIAGLRDLFYDILRNGR